MPYTLDRVNEGMAFGDYCVGLLGRVCSHCMHSFLRSFPSSQQEAQGEIF